MKIIFAGTPDFAAVALQKMIDTEYEIIAVYSEDIAGLRRDFIEAGMLKRDKRGSVYWVSEVEQETA